MRFVVVKSNNKEKVIEAESLDNAEKKADEKYKNWIDIRVLNIQKFLREINA